MLRVHQHTIAEELRQKLLTRQLSITRSVPDLDSAPEPCWLISPGGDVIYVNPIGRWFWGAFDLTTGECCEGKLLSRFVGKLYHGELAEGIEYCQQAADLFYAFLGAIQHGEMFAQAQDIFWFKFSHRDANVTLHLMLTVSAVYDGGEHVGYIGYNIPADQKTHDTLKEIYDKIDKNNPKINSYYKGETISRTEYDPSKPSHFPEQRPAQRIVLRGGFNYLQQQRKIIALERIISEQLPNVELEIPHISSADADKQSTVNHVFEQRRKHDLTIAQQLQTDRGVPFEFIPDGVYPGMPFTTPGKLGNNAKIPLSKEQILSLIDAGRVVAFRIGTTTGGKIHGKRPAFTLLPPQAVEQVLDIAHQRDYQRGLSGEVPIHRKAPCRKYDGQPRNSCADIAERKTLDLKLANQLQEKIGVPFDTIPEGMYPGMPFTTPGKLATCGVTSYSRVSILHFAHDLMANSSNGFSSAVYPLGVWNGDQQKSARPDITLLAPTAVERVLTVIRDKGR